MKSKTLFAAAMLSAAAATGVAYAADPPSNGEDEFKKAVAALQWHVGPGTENIGPQAAIKLDNTLKFLDESNTKQFLKLTGNIPSPGHYLVASPGDGWWSVFSFSNMGYVKDDEKIDADAILKSIKDMDEPGNEERKRLGFGPLHTDGWYVAPHYDTQTKRLEWGLKLHSDEGVTLNYTVRLLGREGVMNATLVSSPEKLDNDVKSFKKALDGFEFASGKRYAEFQPGDHVAEIGLAALVAGGAAAIATKKGFWAVLAGFFATAWKAIVAAVVGLGAWFKSKFNKKT